MIRRVHPFALSCSAHTAHFRLTLPQPCPTNERIAYLALGLTFLTIASKTSTSFSSSAITPIRIMIRAHPLSNIRQGYRHSSGIRAVQNTPPWTLPLEHARLLCLVWIHF